MGSSARPPARSSSMLIGQSDQDAPVDIEPYSRNERQGFLTFASYLYCCRNGQRLVPARTASHHRVGVRARRGVQGDAGALDQVARSRGDDRDARFPARMGAAIENIGVMRGAIDVPEGESDMREIGRAHV